uniref:3-isopropylmalate dehydratase small subunit n=1 Tax=uncultured Enterovirga sp. TaxID=2026352 RepID=UPI0035CB174C
MDKVSIVSGPAAPLLRAQIDTDVIIRIDRLTSLKRDELGPYAFEPLRYLPDGGEDPDFVLNRPTFRRAPILLAGANFGCGSSREGAVWALMGAGLRCVIADSFGDIFYNNCFQNGLLPVALPAATIEQLAAEAAGGAPVTIDLVKQVVTSPEGARIAFNIDPQRREILLEGLDDLGQTLRQRGAI